MYKPGSANLILPLLGLELAPSWLEFPSSLPVIAFKTCSLTPRSPCASHTTVGMSRARISLGSQRVLPKFKPPLHAARRPQPTARRAWRPPLVREARRGSIGPAPARGERGAGQGRAGLAAAPPRSRRELRLWALSRSRARSARHRRCRRAAHTQWVPPCAPRGPGPVPGPFPIPGPVPVPPRQAAPAPALRARSSRGRERRRGGLGPGGGPGRALGSARGRNPPRGRGRVAAASCPGGSRRRAPGGSCPEPRGEFPHRRCAWVKAALLCDTETLRSFYASFSLFSQKCFCFHSEWAVPRVPLCRGAQDWPVALEAEAGVVMQLKSARWWWKKLFWDVLVWLWSTTSKNPDVPPVVVSIYILLIK